MVDVPTDTLEVAGTLRSRPAMNPEEIRAAIGGAVEVTPALVLQAHPPGRTNDLIIVGVGENCVRDGPVTSASHRIPGWGSKDMIDERGFAEDGKQVIEAVKSIVAEWEARSADADAADILDRLADLMPGNRETESLIRMLVQDHPNQTWSNTRPTIEWALGIRMRIDATLLRMVARREIEVTNTVTLALALPGAGQS